VPIGLIDDIIRKTEAIMEIDKEMIKENNWFDSTKLDSKLDQWKKKLFDTSKRNRLLNFKDYKNSTVTIKQPTIENLWEKLVIKEQPLKFPLPKDEVSSDDIYSPAISDESLCENPDGIVTNKSIGDLQRTLRNLRDREKTGMEEQGINFLYLCFGFLNWKEQENSEQFFAAPLLLVPVNLRLESIMSPFVLSLSEDEIVTNPTLLYKLEHDFGMTLNEFNQEQSPIEYFDQVQRKIREYHLQWPIQRETKLGLLSFLKINMYRDLENRSNIILKHPVIRAIGGDGNALKDNARLLESINDFDHDAHEPPDTVFQVLDADSSQQDAILAAKKGISFILQGPPGTGKSQTISNIIAESLARGKKVLFVSEKMAALDVVLQRLTDSGLSDFCMVLHSRKANKKDVLSQLGAVLSLAGEKYSLSKEAQLSLDKLKKEREYLNEYDREIHEVVMPLNTTIFQVNGIIASLASYEDVSFGMKDIEKVSQQKLFQLIADLEKFGSELGDMTDDYLKNPWKGVRIEHVTNKLRYDIGTLITPFIAQISELSRVLESAGKFLNIEFDCCLSSLGQIAAFFKLASESPKVPVEWLRSGSLDRLLDRSFDLVEKWSEFQRQYQDAKKELEREYRNVAALDTTAIFSSELSTGDSTLKQIKSRINEALSGRDYYQIWQLLGTARNGLIDEAERKIIQARELVEILKSKFENDIFELNCKDMYERFKINYGSSFRFIRCGYRSDLKKLRACLKNPAQKMTYDNAISVLKKLNDLEELRKWMQERDTALQKCLGTLYHGEYTNFALIRNEQDAYQRIMQCQNALENLERILQIESENAQYLKSHFFDLYKGFSTDWELVRRALVWAKEMKQSLAAIVYKSSFIDMICADEAIMKSCERYAEQVYQYIDGIRASRQWFSELFDSDESDHIEHSPLHELEERLIACKDNLADLEKWVDLKTSFKKCIEDGLEDYVLKIQSMHIPSKDIGNIFKKRFYFLWLDSILPSYPAVVDFRRSAQERCIREFRSLDKEQFNIAKARIRANLINSLPCTDHFTYGTDEVGILKREIMKQRKIMPIRKLFNAIPNIIMKLKPCLMMSPLSVSQFLECDRFVFDTVIFDEASQVCTEDAIGAISRADQVIIAGDSKQLPPTNFFTAFVTEADYDNLDDIEDDENAYESILEEAALLPERSLRWHYRSRHEDLIAYSNAKIYKNGLITFPSSINRITGYGVEFISTPEGTYDQGGSKGNPREAERIADLVFEHIRTYPNRSLGVISFGVIQQQVIETAIRKKRIEDQRYEIFFNEENHEPFFVKNLETVQGDERDTIIISVGYAKSPAGKPPTNFGPLMHSGGERRLNVAITRARYNIKLVSSIEPTDINTENFSSAGPKLLRGYMEFAQHGNAALDNEIRDSDIIQTESPFEEAVYNFLEQRGYLLATQVGCSDYRIDIGVKHPSLAGRYVLGIECDGATYHSARTARERDRLRQDVLERMGWKIYRIWSTDWIKDPIKEGKDLIKIIDNAIRCYREESIMQSTLEEQDANEGEYLTVSRMDSEVSAKNNPYGFISPKKIDLSSMTYNGDYGENKMRELIEIIIKDQFPLHFDYLCQEVANYLGLGKRINLIQHEIIGQVNMLGLEKRIRRKGYFLYPASYEEIPHYILNDRPIKYVSKDEIASAMLAIAKECIGTTRASLITETIHAYGFARAGKNIKDAMNAAYEQLLVDHQLEEVNGKVSVVS